MADAVIPVGARVLPMRVWVLILLLLAPLGVAGATASSSESDLVVLLKEDADGATVLALAPDARPLTILRGFVILNATSALETSLREAKGVERVERAIALEQHSDASLRLTRADRSATGLGDLAFTGRGVTVAVVDSGIDASHPNLDQRVKANVRLLAGRFFDTPGDVSGHGTHVAGIVAAGGDHPGVAPRAELVGLDISERFTTVSAVLAYDWLLVNHKTHGIRVVVNAWGRAGEREPFDPADSVARAIDRLVDSGVVVLFSSSNHGPGPSTLSFESQHPRVITVGAVDDAAILLGYSSRGPVRLEGGAATWVKPDVVGPGQSIVSLRSLQSAPDSQRDVGPLHRRLSGTSQAVPHVAGIVALMLEANPRLNPAGVQNILRETAIDLAGAGPDDATGFGLADARDATLRALGQAADRGNILVVGGTERYDAQAKLTPTQPEGLLGFTRASDELWAFPFPVKTGATRVAFELSWGPSTAPLSVYLEKDGRKEGPWTRATSEDGRSVIRGRLDDAAVGVWTLRVTGAVPAPLEAQAAVDVTINANPQRALELDSRYRLPEDDAGPGAFRQRVEVLWVEARLWARAHPETSTTLGLAGALLAGLGLVVGRRARIRATRAAEASAALAAMEPSVPAAPPTEGMATRLSPPTLGAPHGDDAAALHPSARAPVDIAPDEAPVPPPSAAATDASSST